MSPTLIAWVAGLLFLGLFFSWLSRKAKRKVSRHNTLAEAYELEPDNCKLLGSDLGDATKDEKIFLSGDGLSGCPDAIFRLGNRTILVGEYKSRRYRGAVKEYERFQLILYMGLAKKRYRCNVDGRIKYGCGTVVDVDWCGQTYKWLLSLKPAFRKLTKSW